MKKIVVAAMAASILTSGAIAGDEIEQFKSITGFNKSEFTLGIGASTMDGEEIAGMAELNAFGVDGFKVMGCAEFDSNYKAYSVKLGSTHGFNPFYAGAGYINAEDYDRQHKGYFGTVGIAENIPFGFFSGGLEVGYRFGEAKGVIAEMNFKNITPGSGVSIRYDNADGFDRGAVYATINF